MFIYKSLILLEFSDYNHYCSVVVDVSGLNIAFNTSMTSWEQSDLDSYCLTDGEKGLSVQKNFNGWNRLGNMKNSSSQGYSSSHPGWIKPKMTCRDLDDSSSCPRSISHQSSSH